MNIGRLIRVQAQAGDAEGEGMELICAFDTDDSEFVRGFEVGVMWQRLQTDDSCEMTVHASNAEMVMRVAEATGRAFTAEDLGEDWIVVSFQ